MKKLRIRFNKNIYTSHAIRSSIEAFKHLANFTVLHEKDAIVVTTDDVDKAVRGVLKDEFCNFVLAELKK